MYLAIWGKEALAAVLFKGRAQGCHVQNHRFNLYSKNNKAIAYNWAELENIMPSGKRHTIRVYLCKPRTGQSSNKKWITVLLGLRKEGNMVWLLKYRWGCCGRSGKMF